MAEPILDIIRHEALSFEPAADGLRPLLEAVGGARLVLIAPADAK